MKVLSMMNLVTSTMYSMMNLVTSTMYFQSMLLFNFSWIDELS
jgi:hypothetical protein